MADNSHKPWDTYRSICGRARVTFHPEWSESLPWATYMDGTAGRQFATLNLAVVYLTEKFKVRFYDAFKPIEGANHQRALNGDQAVANQEFLLNQIEKIEAERDALLKTLRS